MTSDNVELLSPAGDFTTALAAFDAGADAVYCGLGDFSARAFAVNFSADDLRNLVRVAHARGKKVYVTFNTLVDEDALETAVTRLADLADIGPDALIVQDLGVARLVRRHFPELALHASTQLVAHNLEGVLALKELGFTRVVLARELSLDEISSIAKRCGGLELECFIHGALCYSISGLCLFSAMEKGRSGNRGACAYCCRQGIEVRVKGEGEQRDSHHCSPSSFTSYPFSMKDLRLGEDVRKLVDAGVVSLKIEGRMKSALYVASVTKYYRQILDRQNSNGRQLSPVGAFPRNAQNEDDLSNSCISRKCTHGVTVADLETVFSRRTTELYLVEGQGQRSRSTADDKLHCLTSNLQPSTSPIDPTSLGHLGTPVGTVKRVTKDREGRSWVRFHTCRALERHDGLQFVAPSREGRAPARPQPEKPFGFGITEMRTALSRSNVFEVAAGTDVEVLLPEDEGQGARSRSTVVGEDQDVRPGMTVYCSMSNAVKRMFPTPSFRPSDYAGEKALDVTVTLEKTKISAVAQVGRDGARPVQDCGSDAWGDLRVDHAGTFAPAKDPAKTYAAVEKAFSKLGGTDYRLGRLVVNDPDRLFAPSSILNDLRRDLVERADARRAAVRQAKIDAALADDLSRGRISAKCADGTDDLSRGRISAKCADGTDDLTRGRISVKCANTQKTLRLRAGQPIPSGDWDEIVIAINADTQPSTLNSQLSSFNFHLSTLNSQSSPSLRLALPVYTPEPVFNRLRTAVKGLLRAGFAKWEASDLATLRMLKALGVGDITADWTLYAFNSQALAALTELGVKAFVASPENNGANLAYLAESGYSVACLVQQSTPLFISLTEPCLGCSPQPHARASQDGRSPRQPQEAAARAVGDLAIYRKDGLWITTKRTPRTFSPRGEATRTDLSWDPPLEEIAS